MEFCLECQNFVAKKDFVKHLKREHGFRTKKQYTEKWTRKAEEVMVEEMEETSVVEEEEVQETVQAEALEPEQPVLTPGEASRYFELSNTLNNLRMELGRLNQILNGVLIRANEVENQFVEFKKALAAEKGLNDLSWFVDPNTGEIKRQ